MRAAVADNELSEIEYKVLLPVQQNDAHWTSDIARDAGVTTATAGRVLKRLEAYGEVERVVVGSPTSWQRTL